MGIYLSWEVCMSWIMMAFVYVFWYLSQIWTFERPKLGNPKPQIQKFSVELAAIFFNKVHIQHLFTRQLDSDGDNDNVKHGERVDEIGKSWAAISVGLLVTCLCPIICVVFLFVFVFVFVFDEKVDDKLSCHIGRAARHLFVSYLQTNRSNASCHGWSWWRIAGKTTTNLYLFENNNI